MRIPSPGPSASPSKTARRSSAPLDAAALSHGLAQQPDVPSMVELLADNTMRRLALGDDRSPRDVRRARARQDRGAR